MNSFPFLRESGVGASEGSEKIFTNISFHTIIIACINKFRAFRCCECSFYIHRDREKYKKWTGCLRQCQAKDHGKENVGSWEIWYPSFSENFQVSLN